MYVSGYKVRKDFYVTIVHKTIIAKLCQSFLITEIYEM